MVALAATSGEVRAAPLCEPELRPQMCIPGVSTSPECQMRDPARGPDSDGPLELTTPERVVTTEAHEPNTEARRAQLPRAAIGAARPGFARGIDRPPKRAS